MTKKPDYSKTKDQWITRFDARAASAKASQEDAKYDAVEAQRILRKLALFSVSTDPKDLPVLSLIKKKGIDAAYFAVFAHYNDRLTMLSLTGAADPRVEVVISPAEKQRVETIYEVYSALRSACGNAGESVGRVEDAKPIGRGAKVTPTPAGVLEILQQFLANADLLAALLDDAAIGEEELAELRGFVTELQALIASKEARGDSKNKRSVDIELTLLAIDAAAALYKSRSKTATRLDTGLLPRAMLAFPRAPERRKPAAPDKDAAKTDAKADAKTDPKTEAKPDAKSEAKPAAPADSTASAAAPPAPADAAPAPAAPAQA